MRNVWMAGILALHHVFMRELAACGAVSILSRSASALEGWEVNLHPVSFGGGFPF